MDLILPQPPIIAHRGLSFYAPENTMIAFYKAIEQGWRWIECDVMLSHDRIPIVFHDEELARTTNGVGNPGEFSFSYLQTLDAGRWFRSSFAGEKIPSLEQLLLFMQNHPLQLNLEIKPLSGQEILTVEVVLALLKKYPHLRSRILFSSFSLLALQHLRRLDSTCLIGLLLHEWADSWQETCKDLHCVSIHINQEVLTAEKVAAVKASNKALFSYTVNEKQRAEQLFSWGVDAVFSDAPDRIWPL